ncbi:MAG: hypothetical protein GX410_09800 [Elusimicrobia bacterium]|nr:hypothetical protein [Elusimicrobiota bacterium]
MIQVHVKCPKCAKSLMEPKHKLDGKPAIKIALSYAGKKGDLYLSSLYGSYNIELPFSIPMGKIAGFRCPHCAADLKSMRKCEACGAQMVAFDFKQGGQVQICSRRGCKKHVIEFQNPEEELEAFYKAYAGSM